MRKFISLILILYFTTVFAEDKLGNTTVSELLDEARTSIKRAYEVKADKVAKYEFFRAKSYYELAQEETSKLNLDVGKAAALRSIEWSIRAISKAIAGGK